MVNAQQCCPLSSSTCDAGQRFIMNPSTADGIDRFSPCSIGNVCSALGRNSVKSSCLTNNRGVTTISEPICGNGIVEGDEQCDCGGEASCRGNNCCNPTTCRFVNNAVCDDSNEDCCKECQFASSETVCRASGGSCDPEEKCTGSTPYCPEDKTNPDGEDCGNGMKCASGQCTSRDQQCKTIMGNIGRGNDTYACDNSNCQLSCASPEFGRNVCYGLQQNFLDGTPCVGAGKCSNVSLHDTCSDRCVQTTNPPLGSMRWIFCRRRSEELDRQPQNPRHRSVLRHRRSHHPIHPRMLHQQLHPPQQAKGLCKTKGCCRTARATTTNGLCTQRVEGYARIIASGLDAAGKPRQLCAPAAYTP